MKTGNYVCQPSVKYRGFLDLSSKQDLNHALFVFLVTRNESTYLSFSCTEVGANSRNNTERFSLV